MPIIDFLGFFNGFDGAGLLAAAAAYAHDAKQWVQTKYTDAPALVLGVGFALALPAIATAGAILRSLLPHHRRQHTERTRTVRTLPASAWRQRAWLELASSNAANYEIGRGIVRIGRENDNDLCLSDPSVHRYHAVLEHTPDAEYIISYVGDPERDGLLINGSPAKRQRLRGGEVLEIGAIKLRFALSPA